MTNPPRLNIGAGRSPKGEWLNCDLYPGPNIDIVFDACRPWPFRDNSVGTVECHHAFEHLPDVWTFIREAHRVLIPSKFCNLTIRLPYGPGLGGIGDITHLRGYVPQSFCCFQPGYNDFVRNPQHDGYGAFFSVMVCYLRINPRLRHLLKWPLRRWSLGWLEFLWDGFVEMTVKMRALKTPEEVNKWRSLYTADVVPIAPCMYEHEYRGRELRDGETPQLRFFGPNASELAQLSNLL